MPEQPPEGAHKVRYWFDTGDHPPGLTGWEFEVGLSGSAGVGGTLADVAAEAIMDYLREQYPESTVHASRTYTGTLPGGPWPPGSGDGGGGA